MISKLFDLLERAEEKRITRKMCESAVEGIRVRGRTFYAGIASAKVKCLDRV